MLITFLTNLKRKKSISSNQFLVRMEKEIPTRWHNRRSCSVIEVEREAWDTTYILVIAEILNLQNDLMHSKTNKLMNFKNTFLKWIKISNCHIQHERPLALSPMTLSLLTVIQNEEWMNSNPSPNLQTHWTWKLNSSTWNFWKEKIHSRDSVVNHHTRNDEKLPEAAIIHF